MHIKRWLALLLLGVAIMGLGIAYILREAYVSYTFPSVFYYLTLQFIPRFWRGIMFMTASTGFILVGLWHLNSSLLSAVLPRKRDSSLVNIIWGQRYLRRGPKIVAIGGGTGLSHLLRGLKQYTGNLIAIVTVADDGGSSGRLRRELGILPPGDVRNCIAALADAEPLMTKLFQYRFGDGSDLAGHSFGNLFIVAMSGVLGNFEEAIKQTSRVLAVRGQIVPSTLVDVTLEAKTEDEQTIQGEVNISESTSRIKEVCLQPPNPQACPEAIRAILDADMIVVGPGSLLTSVLPNLLVDGIRRAIKASSALKLYVCNVATQQQHRGRPAPGVALGAGAHQRRRFPQSPPQAGGRRQRGEPLPSRPQEAGRCPDSPVLRPQQPGTGSGNGGGRGGREGGQRPRLAEGATSPIGDGGPNGVLRKAYEHNIHSHRPT